MVPSRKVASQKEIRSSPFYSNKDEFYEKTNEHINLERNSYNKICRICLKKGKYSLFDESPDFSEVLSLLTGIKVKPEDMFPKLLCKACYVLLKGAVFLQKTAQVSDQILQEQYKLYNEAKENDIEENYESDTNENNVQNIEKNNFCEVCMLKFQTPKELEQHRLSEEHQAAKKTCPICNKLYSAAYLKKHILVHNTESYSQVCDICGRKFRLTGQLTRHRLTHFYELPFKCTLCPYKGRFSESLKLHMRTHTGEKPYQCAQCPCRFVNSSNLKKHMLTHENKEFQCDICSREFYTKKALESHFKVNHSGIREHECDVCGKAFGYRKQMMKHKLRVHKRPKMKSGRFPLYLQLASKQEN